MNVPNLDDGMNEQELRAFALLCKTLAQYAEGKALAMRWRRNGRIQQALLVEQACDALYQKLPQEWRW